MSKNENRHKIINNLIKDLDFNNSPGIIYSMLNIRDLKLIPYDIFNIINVGILSFTSDDNSKEVAFISLVVAQMLSISGCLKDINPIPDELISDFKALDNVPKDWENTMLGNYLFNEKSNEARKKFISSITKISSEQDLLSAATNFVFYHTKASLSEDEVTQRDMALVNVIKLSIKLDIIKEIKKILIAEFKIDVAGFITDNVELFIS